MHLSDRIESALALLARLEEEADARTSGPGVELRAALRTELTELRAAAREAELTLGLLEIIVRTRDPEECLVTSLHYLMEHFDVEAAGLRLREGDDYPYFSTRGFANEFVVAESGLCQRDANGCPVRDSLGNTVLDCMCGAVIQGRTDPSKPFFTAHGSFWTNSTTELLASTSGADFPSPTRNRCNEEGYESVALVPLRAGDETFGLVQLNDQRTGRFSPEAIALLEDLAERLARVLA